jgi:Asp-tRNA(Asn)/Glu-tRNA(Gln) amidotransferase A subunit family amidase
MAEVFGYAQRHACSLVEADCSTRDETAGISVPGERCSRPFLSFAGSLMEEFYRLTASAAASAIRRGELTSEQLVASCLARIAEREPVVGAWAHLDTAFALSQARSSDAAAKRGEWKGPLHGVPVGVKDIVDTAGLPTENGTPVFAGRRPSRDAAIVTNLKAAGAVILGKTVTTELAFFGPGKTRNPHNPDHTPGGSSSGSAAAVADFHVPLAIGTQTAGSIIRPASYCGVIGFKPTFGILPREGVLEQSLPLDTIGGYARTTEDVAMLVEGMSGPPPRVEPEARLRRVGKESVRFAFIKTLAWPQGEDAMKQAFAHLVAHLGDCVDEVELPPEFAATGGLQRAIQFRDIAKNYGPYLDAHPNVISGKLAEVIGEGRTVSDAEYAAALARRDDLYAALTLILSRYDAILTPAASGPAPRGLASTGSPAFNFLWTYLGMPAISLPLLEANGLPLGVQLVGARGGDAGLLKVAKTLIAMAAGQT